VKASTRAPATIAVHLERVMGTPRGLDDLAGVGAARVRGSSAPQAAAQLVGPVRSRPTQRTVATRRHHWQLVDDTDVEILKHRRDHSRLLVASEARVVFKAADVVTTFRSAA